MERVEPRLAIALCTRDRPEELLRAGRTIAERCTEAGLEAACALILDAGDLPQEARARMIALLENAVQRVEYSNVKDRVRSLYESRLLALARARELGATHVAFFDDDVELLPGYMERLAHQLEELRPAMIGGVDVDLPEPGPAKRLWARFSGTSSGEPGALSGSGFGGSAVLWRAQSDAFASEYVSGCNMIMDVRVLEQTTPDAATVFRTYSLGEDIYFAACAARIGAVVIDPAMRVRHHVSPRSRDGRVEGARQLLVNSAWLARTTGRGRLRFAWTMSCLALRGLAEDVRLAQLRGSTLGMMRGAPEALRLLLRR